MACRCWSEHHPLIWDLISADECGAARRLSRVAARGHEDLFFDGLELFSLGLSNGFFHSMTSASCFFSPPPSMHLQDWNPGIDHKNLRPSHPPPGITLRLGIEHPFLRLHQLTPDGSHRTGVAEIDTVPASPVIHLGIGMDPGSHSTVSTFKPDTARP